MDPSTVLIGFEAADVAEWLSGGSAPRALIEAGEVVVSRGLPLVPVHPGSADPTLAAWFSVEVPPDDIDEVLRLLRASPAVAAAYVKPPDALPG